MYRVTLLLALTAGCASGGGDGADADREGTDSAAQAIDESVDPVGFACSTTVDDHWNRAHEERERMVLELTNEQRAAGARCGTRGVFGAAEPLTWNSNLACSARFHSLWMGHSGNFDHDSPGGELGDDPFERMSSAGYTGFAAGENIAAGYASARKVVDGWMTSDGHCANIMAPEFNELGVGAARFPNDAMQWYWTQNFGSR